MKRRHSRLALMAAGVLAMTVIGEAAATPPTPSGGPTWAPNQYVPYRWKEGIEPPAWMGAAVNAAAADSNASRASRAGVLGYQGGAESWVGYSADISAAGAIAYTVANQPSNFHIKLRAHGYVFDWGKLRWCQYSADQADGCYDAEMITLHEFGHVQSLNHPDESLVTDWLDTIMHQYPKSKAKAGWSAPTATGTTWEPTRPPTG